MRKNLHTSLLVLILAALSVLIWKVFQIQETLETMELNLRAYFLTP